MVFREDFEQERFGFDLDAVDLIDQQHDWLIGADGFEQRAFQQELFREDVVLEFAPFRLATAVGLDAKQLLLVVPLIQRLGLVEPLVALQTNELCARHLGHGLGQLGLTGTGGAFDQNRLFKPVCEVHNASDCVVGEIVNRGQLVANLGHVVKAMIH